MRTLEGAVNFSDHTNLSNVLNSHARTLYLRSTMSRSSWMAFGC